MTRRHQHLRAFSLMEIMVAVIIIGVLSFIAVPKLFDLLNGSQAEATEASALAIGREALARAAQDTATLDDSYLTTAVANAGARYELCEATPGSYLGVTPNLFTVRDTEADVKAVVYIDSLKPGGTISEVVVSNDDAC